MEKRNRRFFVIFAVSYLLVALAIILFKRWDILPRIEECNPNGYDGGHFMAYCHSTRYGDYEHWAYWNEADPVSIAAVKRARVLFLGNSRTQYAFSTAAVSDFFRKTGIAHYVFGFGMGSYSPVPEKMMAKHGLKPDVLIINADPFFADVMNPTNEKMLKTDFLTRWEFAAKRLVQKAQQRICADDDDAGFLHRHFCSGTAETIYREPRHGHWKTDYYRPNKHIPVTYTDFLLDKLDDTVEQGEAFIRKSGVPKSCVILTVTPRTGTPLAFARRLAERLGTPAVFPDVDHLVTIDDSHLDDDSAERWSAAFLAGAAPYIQACTGRAAAMKP